MFEWLGKKIKKASVLSEIVVSETTNKNRDEYDSASQHAIRDRMKGEGYDYIGKGGSPDATDPKSYKP